MATLTGAVIARLQADATLTAALTGGIWDRPLIHGYDPGATPGAFEPGPGGTGVVLRPAAAVTVGGIGISFAGTALISGLGGVTLGATRGLAVWLYQPYPARDLLPIWKARVIAVLAGMGLPTDAEGQAVLKFVGDLGEPARDTDLNAYVEQVRFVAATMLGRVSA